MDIVSFKSQTEGFDVSVGEQVVEIEPEQDQVPSILVDVIREHTGAIEGFVEVKLFGEELKQRLKGHTFFFREDGEDRVRRFPFDLIND
jgi:hypothetical protein